MLSAYESALRQSCEDEAECDRLRGQLYAEPPEVRRARVAAGRAAPAEQRVGLTSDAVAALLSSAAEQDSLYGSG